MAQGPVTKGSLMQPRSIKQFSWLYLAIIALDLALAFFALFYIQTTVQDSGHEGLNATAGTAAVLLILFFGLVIPIILWACVVFFGSRIAKWVLAIFSGLSSLRTVLGLTGPFSLFGVFSILSAVLTIMAIILLFMPDAQEWFREQRG